ncbi:MAG TPA: DnaJ domain-containing protein [Sphingomicrobium sp.]|jgi:hypothetical protein
MTGEPTYYELLGVAEKASAHQIREAYLRLVKKHHPDLARAGGAASKPDLVPLLNRGYAVLRDPQKRAAYDARLPRAAVLRLVSSPSPGRALPPRRRGRSALAVAMTAATGLIAIALAGHFWVESPDAPSETLAGPLWSAVHAPGDGPVFVAPAEALIQSEARAARVLSTQSAVTRSQHCFQAARAKASLEAAKLCIIFDYAFLFWRKGPGDVHSMPIYFNDELAHARHAAALSQPGDRSDEGLRYLRNRAFQALLSDVTATDTVQPGVPLPAWKGQELTTVPKLDND